MKWPWPRRKNLTNGGAEPPLNPRVKMRDGSMVRLEARYLGTDEDGIRQWTLFPASMADFERLQTVREPEDVQVLVDKVPERTAVSVALKVRGDQR